MIVPLALLLLTVVDPTTTRAQARKNTALLDEAAQLLTVDANAPAALRLLEGVAGKTDENDRRLDHVRFWRLRGHARALVGLAAAAVDDLGRARASGLESDVSLNRELAQQHRALGHFDRCADVLVALPDDDGAVLLATCLRATPRAPLAHDVLAGRQSLPAVTLRARIRLEDHQPRLARDDVAAVVDVLADDEVDAFAAAFARDDADFAAVLGDIVAVRRQQRVRPTPRAGVRALPLITDERARLRARLTLLVDAAAWDELQALRPRVVAAGFLDDDDVRYALAWAGFATGHLDDADAALDGMTTSSGFARAATLRASIARCRTDEATCPR